MCSKPMYGQRVEMQALNTTENEVTLMCASE